jgi:hypothetical protein
MAHRLLSQKNFSVFPGTPQSNHAEIRRARDMIVKDLSSGIPVVVADNIADYVAALVEDEKLSFDDLPRVKMPFDNFFIEWKTPATIDDANQDFSQFGAHIYKGDDAFVQSVAKERSDIASVYIGFAYMTVKRTGLVCSSFSFLLCLDVNGSVLRVPLIGWDGKTESGERSAEISTIVWTTAFMRSHSSKVLDATETEGPSPQWCKRQRVKQVTYKTILVRGVRGRRKRGERKTEGDRSGKALHIRKGHFMEFIDDGVSKGLFGKYIFGLFWVEACMVGSEELGQVSHIYDVRVPK